MLENRTQNAIRNMIFGLTNKLVSVILPFVTRTIILHYLGSHFLGLGSLFSSILSFLNLSELGLSAAIVQTMYQPIAEQNEDRICMLLRYYRSFYRVVGAVILGAGMCLLPFLPKLIKGTPPDDVNIYVLFCMYLANTAVSYFFAAYKQSLFTAHQRSDIISRIHIVVNVTMQAGQILALLLTKNYYIYAFLPLSATLITNLVNAVLTNKMYPRYKCRGKLDLATRGEIRKKITGLIGTKINSVVVHAADTVVISSFLGLTDAAMYDNYYYIINSISAFVVIFFSSVTAGTGHSMVTESLDKNRKLFNRLALINSWGVGWCSVCLICLLRPFMEIWVGDEYVLPMNLEILFVLYFFIYNIQRVILMFKDAAGLWYEDRFRPYISMIVNVLLNLTLVQFIGLQGVILSTIVAFLISVPLLNRTLFRCYFGESGGKNLLQMLTDLLITVFASGITYSCCAFLPKGLPYLLIRMLVCIVVPNVVFYFAHRKKEAFPEVKNILQEKYRKGETNKTGG